MRPRWVQCPVGLWAPDSVALRPEPTLLTEKAGRVSYAEGSVLYMQRVQEDVLSFRLPAHVRGRASVSPTAEVTPQPPKTSFRDQTASTSCSPGHASLGSYHVQCAKQLNYYCQVLNVVSGSGCSGTMPAGCRAYCWLCAPGPLLSVPGGTRSPRVCARQAPPALHCLSGS